MCQLCAVSLGRKDINIIATQLMHYKGSFVHDDGFGFMYEGKFRKTEIEARKINNFGDYLNEYVKSNRPIFSHIRQATAGVTVSKDNAHPFESEDFILMHNGTLVKGGDKKPVVTAYKKYNSVTKKYDEPEEIESDSKVFLEHLQSSFDASRDKNFVDVFNEAMSKFWGKFAFLIYAKKSKKYYAIRGRTAPLFISYQLDDGGDHIGYLINTSKENIDECSTQISNINQAIRKERVNLKDPEPFELESINELMGTIFVKIGDCSENIEKDFEVEVEPKVTPSSSTDTKYLPEVVGDVVVESCYVAITNFMLTHFLSPKDMEILFRIFMAVDMVSCSKTDMEEFVSQVIPKISISPKSGVRQFLYKNLKGAIFPYPIYAESNLDYPWTLNSEEVIVAAVKKHNRLLERA